MDAVILYVNCDDPEWQKEYYRNTVTPLEFSRFRDWGTLPFLFRGIAKYLPFIEKVHLVVSGESQVPEWIDRERVHIVLHKDIMPKEYLPNFNSCMIETHIPYIEGLSEEFLYFNDDMFPINPCKPELFFREGRPQLYLMTKKKDAFSNLNLYRSQCCNSSNMARRALGMKESLEFFYPPHWPHPILKSQCLEVLEKMKDEYREQASVLRTAKNVNQYLFLAYEYLNGKADSHKLPFAYCEPEKSNIHAVATQIETSSKAVLTLNDSKCSPMDYGYCRRVVLAAFSKKLGESCKYEKAAEKKEELIISMTSYPARIDGVAQVWQSILDQTCDVPFRCALALAEPEFPDRKLPEDLQKLVNSGKVELIWWPRNIRSHKKIIPVLKKYPDASVIVVDDDILRPQGWLQGLVEDHKKHPREIITGLLTSFLDGEGNWQRVTGFQQRTAHGKNHIPGLVSHFIRFGSGSGTYFPAHTFTDSRFFDENLMMRLSPTSDESWMFLFAVLKDMTIRQSSQIYDESELHLPGSQQVPMALYKINKLKYNEIWAKLQREFPEFNERIVERRRRVIVSIASYTERFGSLDRVITSLQRQTIKPERIVLCIAEGDQEYLPEEVKWDIDHGNVELLLAGEDLRPHNKYFWAMQKYQDHAIITVDDDAVYAPTMVESLLKGYWFHPDCVIARRVHRILRENGEALPYRKWDRVCKSVTEPSLDLLATGVGGVLYPPNILNLSEKNLPKIRETIIADDLYLKYIENIKRIKVLYVKDREDTSLDCAKEGALYKENVFNGGNDRIVAMLRI